MVTFVISTCNSIVLSWRTLICKIWSMLCFKFFEFHLQALKPESKEEAPELWAMDALTEPIVRKLYYHFVEDEQTNSVSNPEWLFHFAEKTVRKLADESQPLSSFLTLHGLQKMYHLPFEFARCIRTGVQVLLLESIQMYSFYSNFSYWLFEPNFNPSQKV